MCVGYHNTHASPRFTAYRGPVNLVSLLNSLQAAVIICAAKRQSARHLSG